MCYGEDVEFIDSVVDESSDVLDDSETGTEEQASVSVDAVFQEEEKEEETQEETVSQNQAFLDFVVENNNLQIAMDLTDLYNKLDVLIDQNNAINSKLDYNNIMLQAIQEESVSDNDIKVMNDDGAVTGIFLLMAIFGAFLCFVMFRRF